MNEIRKKLLECQERYLSGEVSFYQVFAWRGLDGACADSFLKHANNYFPELKMVCLYDSISTHPKRTHEITMKIIEGVLGDFP